MLGRVLALVLLVVGLAGVSTLVLVAFHSKGKPQVAAGAPIAVDPTIALLTAAHDLNGGGLLHPADLSSRSFPLPLVPADAIRDTPEERAAVLGALLRISISSGGLISPGAIVKPGDHGYLAAILHPGKVAVAISVDAVTGVAGLVWPGDIVDLIVAHTLEGDASKSDVAKAIAAETVLSGIRVLAIDQDMEHGKTPGGNVRDTRTVTLEVAPDQAEVVAAAGLIGRLSVSVRSMANGQDPTPVHTTWGYEISPALAAARTPSQTQSGVHVYNGVSEAANGPN